MPQCMTVFTLHTKSVTVITSIAVKTEAVPRLLTEASHVSCTFHAYTAHYGTPVPIIAYIAVLSENMYCVVSQCREGKKTKDRQQNPPIPITRF